MLTQTTPAFVKGPSSFYLFLASLRSRALAAQLLRQNILILQCFFCKVLLKKYFCLLFKETFCLHLATSAHSSISGNLLISIKIAKRNYIIIIFNIFIIFLYSKQVEQAQMNTQNVAIYPKIMGGGYCMNVFHIFTNFSFLIFFNIFFEILLISPFLKMLNFTFVFLSDNFV